MVEPMLRIRPFQLSDDRQVRFVLGKANMESLAVANRLAIFHPLTLSLWVALSCIMVQLLDWWPKAQYGWSGYLNPIPAFACWTVPTFFLMDWINRSYFDDLTLDILRRPDVVDIQKYYALSPSSGFFVLEYERGFIGLIAIDASKESESDETIIDKISSKKAKTTGKPKNANVLTKGTSRIATIRHFYVDEPYRKADMQNDLLEFAVRHAFEGTTTVQEIRATDSPLLSYIGDCLKKNGFKLDKYQGQVGIYRWKVGTKVLTRAEWTKEQKEKHPS